jgi:trk system potassium uptake protein TrkA
MRVIVIGAGEVGFNIADILSKEGNDVIIIDKSEERLKDVAENLDVQTIQGSGSSPEILRTAKLDQSDMVVAVTDSDETNIVACLLASVQSKGALKIARIRNQDLNKDSAIFDKNHLNIDLCINPERESVNNVMNLIEYPGASEIIDFAGGRIKLAGFHINSACTVVGKKLQDIKEMCKEHDFLIASIIRKYEPIVPSGKTTIEENDYLFVLAESENVLDILKFFGKDVAPVQRVFIVGGGKTALLLSEELEKKGIFLKIIEKRQNKCEILASHLNKSVILHGNGTSQDLLKEENIQDADYLIAVTNDEEANILAALLAKQLGAKKTISLINRVDYSHLVSSIGIDGVMNPRHATIGKILHFIRKGKVISATPLHDEKAEAVEFIALETSEITNKPLKNIKLPKGTIIGAIIREDNIHIPGGNSIIKPGDLVILVTLRSAIPKVEKILTVKLDYFE